MDGHRAQGADGGRLVDRMDVREREGSSAHGGEIGDLLPVRQRLSR